MSPKSWLGAALAAAALATGAPAFAATLQTIDVPPEVTHPSFDLHPYVGLDESYDSNVFLLPSPVGSWIHTARAGARAPMAVGERQRLELSYHGAYRSYSYSKEASLKNAFIHAADARYWYEGETGLRLRARDGYLNTIDPATTELTGLRRRWANTARLEAAYEPEERRLHFGIDAQQTRHKYVSDDPAIRLALDRYEQLVGLKLGWQLQPKTVAYAAYHRQAMHFTDGPSPSRDNKGDLFDFGVEGQLSAKLTGRAQIGMVARRYDAAPGAGQARTTRNLTALVSTVWEPVDRAKAELVLTRSLQESAYDVNQFYIATAAGLGLSHRFMWGLRARVDGGLEWDKYPTTTQVGPLAVNRRDDNYSTGAALEYPVRGWLNAGVSYLYRARFSRGLGDLFSYRDHLTTLSLTATY